MLDHGSTGNVMQASAEGVVPGNKETCQIWEDGEKMKESDPEFYSPVSQAVFYKSRMLPGKTTIHLQ